MGKFKKLLRRSGRKRNDRVDLRLPGRSFSTYSSPPIPYTRKYHKRDWISVKFNNLSKETTVDDLHKICEDSVSGISLAGSSRIIQCPNGDANFGYVNFCSSSDACSVVDFIRQSKPQLKGNNISAVLRLPSDRRDPIDSSNCEFRPTSLVTIPKANISDSDPEPSTSSGKMRLSEEHTPPSPGTPPYEDLIETHFKMKNESYQCATPIVSTPHAKMSFQRNFTPMLMSSAFNTPSTHKTPMPMSSAFTPPALPFQKPHFVSRQRSPNVVKVNIFGDNIKGSELDSFFGQYGKIMHSTKVLQGKPNYAYINYDTPLSAANACQQLTLVLKGTKLQLIPPSTSLTPCMIDHRHIECDELIAKYLKPKAEEALQKRLHLASVHVQINNSGGIDLWNQGNSVQEASQVVEEILKSIKDDMVVEELKLNKLVLPALLETNEGDTFRRLDEMQKQTPFELTIKSQTESEKSMSLYEFSKMLRTHDDELTTVSDVLNDFVIHSSSGTLNRSLWLWERKNHKFVPYSKSIMDTLNKHFSDADCTKQVKCEVEGQKYNIDLEQMTQTNIYTQRRRKIKRFTRLSPEVCKITLQLRTYKAAISTLKENIEEAFQKSIKIMRLPLPSATKNSSKDILLPLESKLFVRLNVSDECDSQILLVSGIHTYLKRVALPEVRGALLSLKQDMLEEHTKKALQNSTPTTDFPSNWDDSKEMIVLISIHKGSPEWNEIETLLHSTLPKTDLIKLERIQNKWLWSAYLQSKERMFVKNGGEVKELRLFHGTSTTPPKKIYESEKGFDFRFSRPGMWGTGTYFAENASYSNDYAYHPAAENEHSITFFPRDRPKQLIVAKVLTGHTINLKPRCNLTKPPLIQPSTKATTVFEGQCYDSVQGFTNDSQIYVVYEHDKAYPEYLLTYTEKKWSPCEMQLLDI